MKYAKANDRIISTAKATHLLTETICDAGYLKTLEKGSLCKIGETWINFYGRWTSIIDIDGCTYDIRPDDVAKVTKELPQADTIEELCDFIVFEYWSKIRTQYEFKKYESLKELYANEYLTQNDEYSIYSAMYIKGKGLIFVAKMKGALPNCDIDWELL